MLLEVDAFHRGRSLLLSEPGCSPRLYIVDPHYGTVAHAREENEECGNTPISHGQARSALGGLRYFSCGKHRRARLHQVRLPQGLQMFAHRDGLIL